MRSEDLPSILQIEQSAFNAKHSREPLYLKKYLEFSPQACFVATHNNKVIGFVFSIINGPVGWIALLAVHPQFQRQTIGKTLFLETLNYLRSKTETVGLQLPYKPEVLSPFLINSGFQFVEPQIIFSAKTTVLKSFNQDLPEFPLNWDDIYNVNIFAGDSNKSNLTTAVNIKNDNFHYGTFVLETKHRRQSENLSIGIISSGGCIRNLSCSFLTYGLNSIAVCSEKFDFDEIYFAINSFYNREIEWLCRNGCIIKKIVQRMVMTKSVSSYKQLLSRPQIDLTNWSV